MKLTKKEKKLIMHNREVDNYNDGWDHALDRAIETIDKRLMYTACTTYEFACFRDQLVLDLKGLKDD